MTTTTDDSHDSAADLADYDERGEEAYVPPPDDWPGDLMDHESVAHSGLLSTADY